MLGPSAGTLCCFRFVEGRRSSANLVLIMVSRDLVIAEDRRTVDAVADTGPHDASSHRASDARCRTKRLLSFLVRYRRKCAAVVRAHR